MEVDKSKCLICEVSCHQKGLSFFKFPKEESRLKVWMKEISPLLNIFKIRTQALKENGRICSRHFREKDFINSKKNSLVRNARPSLAVSNVNLCFNYQNENEKNFDKQQRQTDQLSNEENEKDLFQCGRCKAQFGILSDFIDHKRFKCHPVERNLTKDVTEKTETPSYDFLFPLKNCISNIIETPLTQSFEPKNNESPVNQVVNVISHDLSGEEKLVSLVMKEDGLVIENTEDISSLPSQMILTSDLPLCFNGVVTNDQNNVSLAGQVIVSSHTPISSKDDPAITNLVTADAANSRAILYTCPLENNNGLIITSEVPTDSTVLMSSVPSLPSNILNPDNSLTFSGSINTDCTTADINFSRNDLEKEEIAKLSEETGYEKPRSKLPCSYCGKLFEKPFNLQQHERVHTGERPFQCIICGRAFTQKSNVRKHMMRHRVWPKGKQTLKLKKSLDSTEIDYSCQYCSCSFKSYGEHKKHLSVHSNFKVYRCIQKNCDETFSDLDEFLTHSKMHSSAEFQCHVCLKTFTNLEELGIHQYDHDTTGKEKRKQTEIKLKCEICHARFKTAESLKNHMAVDTHHYACVHCHSVFSSERFLRRHLFIHINSSQLKFECSTCKKCFRTQQNLTNHEYIHSKEKPFTCDQCEKQFASKYRLKRHLAIHLNNYMECPFKKHLGCDRTFYRKDKLRDHVNTHSHCKLRSCRICSKTYWNLTKLNLHMRKDHKPKSKATESLKCFSCSQAFRKQKQLSQHHCTVEERKSSDKGRHVVVKDSGPETVSNIEIIMVPFSTHNQHLT